MRESPKLPEDNTINRDYMADCLLIARHEPRHFRSRTDPAIIPFQCIYTMNSVPREQGAASSHTHHTELVAV